MIHSATYKLKNYRVVEEIEKVADGYRWRVTAHDDEAAREMPFGQTEVIRFDAERVAPTEADARKELAVAVQLMRKS